MSLSRLLRTLAEKRRLDRALKARKAIHKANSEAAKRGVSASWCRRGAAARKLFAN